MNEKPPIPGDEPSCEQDASNREENVVSHRITRRVQARRLDKYLHERHPRISRTALQRYIKEGLVTVNGHSSKASYEPLQGDVVRIVLPPPAPKNIVPEDIPIDVLYEDQWLLVINKQVGLICHPARATQSGTIANAVAYHTTTLSRGGDPARPGIIHRLDKNTSGAMVIAKTDEAHWRIALQFERRTVRKEYYAICEGRVALDGDIINKPLAPHQATTQRMVLPGINPPRQAMFKEAFTEYRVDKRFRGFTTVNLFPKTGRTHQLRVHMASIGHPIAGDTLYGGHVVSEHSLSGQGEEEPFLIHQALHARRLRFEHPIHEKPLEVEAPLHEHMIKTLSLLEEYRTR